ncbi:hypothetical protein LCGC14_3102360, partial [marine sediment metagenome]
MNLIITAIILLLLLTGCLDNDSCIKTCRSDNSKQICNEARTIAEGMGCLYGREMNEVCYD